MDMKKILQAMDGISARPVNGADSMARFLRVVKEANLNQPAPGAVTPTLKVPPIPQLPAQDGDQGNGEMVQTNQDGTRSYSGAFGTFTYDASGKATKYSTPSFSGASQTIDLTNNQTTQNYSQGPMNTQQTTDAKGNVVSSNADYDLGVGKMSVGQDAKGIKSKQWNSTDTANDGMTSKDLYAMGDKSKEATYNRAMAQVNNTTVQESINKFLQIVKETDAPTNITSTGKTAEDNFASITQAPDGTFTITYHDPDIALINTPRQNEPRQPHTGIPTYQQAVNLRKQDFDSATEIMSLPASIKAYEAVGDFAADPKQQATMYLQFHTGMMDPSTLPAFMAITPGVSLAVQPPTGTTGSHEEILASLSAANKRLPKDLQVSWDELKDIGGVSDTIKLTGEPHPDTYNPATDPVQENSLSKFLSIVKKNDVSILNEGANPHKVALPVQMAMQHYQQVKETPQPRERLIDKYFVEAEAEIIQKKEEKRALYNQYAKTIANRVLMKESVQGVLEGDVPADPNKLTASMLMGGEYKELDLTPLIVKNNWVGTPKQVINQADKWLSDFLRQRGNMYSNLKIKYKGLTMTSSKIGDVDASDPEFESMVEAPIAMDPAEPNNPTIHNHEKANTMSLKGRIMSARAQLKELAELAESDSLLVWEQICKKAKGGMFMGLEQNLEQIRHGIEQLAAKRKKGGVGSRGIDRNIGEGKTK